VLAGTYLSMMMIWEGRSEGPEREAGEVSAGRDKSVLDLGGTFLSTCFWLKLKFGLGPFITS
jgi:hypothetical protein